MRRIGVGFFGNESFLVGGISAGSAGGLGSLNVSGPIPRLGVRYWSSKRAGIEVAAGIPFGVRRVGSELVVFGLGAHMGVPIALASSNHFTPIIVPYADAGFMTPNSFEQTVIAAELGVRAGAEVQFGFLDIPALALQGTVGIGLRYVHVESQTVATNAVAFTTSVQGEPWDVFTGNIAAIYYF